MSRIIWKFPIPQEIDFTIAMPAKAEIIFLAVQGQTATLWAVVDPDNEMEHRWFAICGTGNRPVADNCSYVGSWLADPAGTFVFHLFEVVT